MKLPPRERWRRRLILVGVAYLLAKGVAWCVPHPPLRERFSSSVAVYDAHHHLLRLTLAPDEQYRLWTPLAELSPSLVEGTLLYEDRHFRHHPGFNPIALGRAAFSTYGGERRIGGSTITMQLARRLWDIPSRTPWGKVRQLARAVQLELQYSKDEILEAYLNLAPYGGNVEGAGAASLLYFGKPAARLTLPEALALSVIPQNPSQRARSQPLLRAARASLFESWVARHPEARRDEQLFHLPLVLHGADQLPFLAPHFVDEVLARPHAPSEVVTSLDLRLQRLVERHLRAYVARKRDVGIHNACALLVDARTREVRALVGSADFRDPSIAGQVNGVLGKRSPGSTLKPFVYALGIDQGVIHPESMLRDVPTSFAAYSPENFDGRFAGPLSAREALIRSRNIPALDVAGKLNRPGLYDFLRTSGISRLKRESYYGLGLTLGAAELTMEELVTLYAALHEHGVVHPLRFAPDEPLGEGTRVLSAEASFMTLDILKDNPRPDQSGSDGTHRAPVAWKTGTSWGFRDAWAVGTFGPYVLAVWVGNFSGEGNPAFVGAQAAAPLFFEMVDSIVVEEPRLPPLPLDPPPRAKKVTVCAVSGQLPTASCPHKKTSWFIPGRSPIEPCRIHKAIAIDDATGKRACPPFRGPTHSEVYELWPSDLQKLFAQAGLPRRSVPPPAPGCSDGETAGGRAPRITSPLRGVTYTLQRGKEEVQRVALQAVTDADANEVFWFVDESFVGKARSGTPLFFRPGPGAFVVRAVDDLSRADSRELRVEYAR